MHSNYAPLLVINVKLVVNLRDISLLIYTLFPQNLVEESIWPMLVKESLKALGGLGLLSLGGKYLLRRVFEVCIFSSINRKLQIDILASGNQIISLYYSLLQKREAQKLLLLSAYLQLLGHHL